MYYISVLNDTLERMVKVVDRFKLEYEMKSRGISVKQLCEHLKISKSAYYRKCKGISQFTQGEIQKIVDFLELDSPMGIFFKQNVSQKTLHREK